VPLLSEPAAPPVAAFACVAPPEPESEPLSVPDPELPPALEALVEAVVVTWPFVVEPTVELSVGPELDPPAELLVLVEAPTVLSSASDCPQAPSAKPVSIPTTP